MTLHLTRALLVLSAASCWTTGGSAYAQGDDCEVLGTALTEHTCFHARFGPFVERVASRGASVGATTPDVDPVHTFYRVAVPVGAVSAVTYTPSRSGRWAFFVEPDVPFTIRSPVGSTVLSRRVPSDGSCPFLDEAHVTQLTADERYVLIFGVSTTSEVTVVIEKLDDFSVIQGRDRDGDGFGDPNDVVVDACLTRDGYAPNDYDCDDDDPDVSPAAREVCDGVDQDCDGNTDDVGSLCTSGVGECAETGVSSCPTLGADAVCSAAPGPPAIDDPCNGVDDDCDGTTDEEGAALCAASSDHPRCVSTGVGAACGCETDADCGDTRSARICFLRATEQRCISGCIEAFGRNACPEGEHCTSRDPAEPGTCVPDAAIDAGLEDASTATDAIVDGDADASTDAVVDGDASPADADGSAPNGSGCACGTADARGGPTWGAIGVGLLLFVVLATRRARSTSAVATVATCHRAQLITRETDAIDRTA